MTQTADLQAIVELTNEIDPSRVAREIEWMSAGCKGISYQRMRGPVNDEPAAPSTDPIDEKLKGRARAYGIQLTKARKALEEARDIQDEIVSRLMLAQAQKLVEMEAGGGVCSNCGYIAEGTREDRIVKTRCKLCYPYWRAHGEERPRELVEASL